LHAPATTEIYTLSLHDALPIFGLGVVGVADVDAHRHAHQLAAEMILQAGAGDLLAVVEIFRPDEAHDRVDEQRLERAGISLRRRSEEHTSELQSLTNIVCRLLL